MARGVVCRGAKSSAAAPTARTNRYRMPKCLAAFRARKAAEHRRRVRRGAELHRRLRRACGLPEHASYETTVEAALVTLRQLAQGDLDDGIPLWQLLALLA
jgi:hypothetical protein